MEAGNEQSGVTQQQLKELQDRLSTYEQKDLYQSQRLDKLEIGTNYFGNVLDTQLAYFSILVAVIVGLSWLLTYKVSKQTIADETKKNLKITLDDVEEKFAQSQEALDIKFAKENARLEKVLLVAESNISRAFGMMHEKNDNSPFAFIWFMRAAGQRYKSGDKSKSDMVLIFLNYANVSLRKASYGYEISSYLDEIKTILSIIQGPKYAKEIEEINTSLKALLSKEPVI